MSINITQLYKKDETGKRPQNNEAISPSAYQSEAGINLSELARSAQAASYEAPRSTGGPSAYDLALQQAQQAMAARTTSGPSAHTTPRASSMSALDRAKTWSKNVGLSAILNTISSKIGGQRALYETGQGMRSRQNQEDLEEAERSLELAKRNYEIYLEEANGDVNDSSVVSQRYIVEDLQREVDAYRKVINEKVQERATEAAHELANTVSKKGEQSRTAAKAAFGNTWLGNVATDAAISGVERIGDVTTSGLAGGGPAASLLMMGNRVYGSGVTQAKNYADEAGDQAYAQVIMSGGTSQQAKAAADKAKAENQVSIGRQNLYGVGAAGVELFTESMFDGLAGIYGAGSADSMVEALIRRLAGTNAGRTALRTIAGMGGEAIEELASNIANPALMTAYTGKSIGESYRENFSWTDAAYDAIVGAASAGFSQVTRPVSTIRSNARANRILQTADEIQASLQEQGQTRREAARGADLAARKLYYDEMSEREAEELKGNQQAEQTGNQLMVNRYLDQALAGETVTEEEKSILKDGYETGSAAPADYVADVMNAYSYGKSGMTLEQAKLNAEKAGSTLNNVQFQHAFQMGAGAVAETVDTGTAEGKETLVTHMQALGSQAEAAAAAYQPGQDVGKFRQAMTMAVQLYAGNGQDLQQLWQDAKAGRTLSSISYLTESQIATAQRLGNEYRAEQQKLTQERAAAYKETVQQAQDVLAEENKTLGELNTAIDEAMNYILAQQGELDNLQEGLNVIREAQPGIENTEEYKAEQQKIAGIQENIQNTQELVQQLRAEKDKVRGKRRKGKAVFATQDGKAGKLTYKAVDQSKLSDTQKAVVQLAKLISRATGVNILLADIQGKYGGEYFQGGRIVLNINIAPGGKNIAAMSLAHELTHWLQQYAPEQYAQLKQIVIDEIMKNPQNFSDIFTVRQNAQTNLSPDQITDEMVANACQTVLLDEAVISNIAQNFRTLGEKIIDFINDFMDTVRAAFSEIDPKSNFTLYREVRAVEGAMEEIRNKWMEAFNEAQKNYQAEGLTEGEVEGMEAAEGSGEQYSRFVEDEDTLNFLDEQEKAGKVIHVYKSFLEIDGKLYPPMASKKSGGKKAKLVKPLELNRWEESVGKPDITLKPGEKYAHVNIFKDNGKPTEVAYNPYQHASNLMLNDQFSEAYNRPNLVTYECIVPESELTSGYWAKYAKDPVGWHPWKSGKVASQIRKAKGLNRDVFLSRWMKPIRRVPDAEVAQHYKELLEGTDIAVPSNVVPPSLLAALEDAGVKIKYTKQAPKHSKSQEYSYKNLPADAYYTDGRIYDYDFLVAQEDMPVASMPSIKTLSGGDGVKKNAVNAGIKNAASVGTKVTDTMSRVRNRYTERDMQIGKKGIEHGLGAQSGGALKTNTRIAAIAGEVVKNGIPINGLTSDRGGQQIAGTYALATMIRSDNEDGSTSYFVAISTIEQVRNNLETMDVYDVTHSLSGRIKRDGRASRPEPDSTSVTPISTISIADFLDVVNETHRSILSDDVLKHYGEERPADGYYTGKALFQTWDELTTDELYSEMEKKQAEWTEALKKFRELNAEEEKIFKGEHRTDEAFLKEYKKWADESGYEAAYKRERELRSELYELRNAYDARLDQEAEAKERENIQNSGLSEAEYFAKKAVKEFGYTPYYGEAGYIMPNGRMLNFSGEKGRHDGVRGQDHRAIETIFATSQRTEAMNRFINYGNIRMMDGSGLDMSAQHEPTAEQYRTIRDFVRKRALGGYFAVDFTGETGDVIGTLEYENDPIRANGVVDDIKNYYQNGQLQTYEQMEFSDVTRADMSPEMRQKMDEAERLGDDIRSYFSNVSRNSKYWLNDEELDEALEHNLYQSNPDDGDMRGADLVMFSLSGLAKRQSGEDRYRTYLLMERIMPHLSTVQQQQWKSTQDEAFADWYNLRHPSIYYSGYQPGDLFRNERNISRERMHLHLMLEMGTLQEPELSDFREFLDRLNNPEREAFYQTWDEEHNDWAPTFYSKLENTLTEWTNGKGQPLPEKMSAAQVQGWLKGKGVKDEEIRWSGIVPYLEGKKTVTRDELLQVMQGNMVKIETITRSSYDRPDTYVATFDDGSDETFDSMDGVRAYAEKLAKHEGGSDAEIVEFENGDYGKDFYWEDPETGELNQLFSVSLLEGGISEGETRWGEYITNGGKNYREILFHVPGSNYDNQSMRLHWGTQGVLAHARVQDLTDFWDEETGELRRNEKRVLFIEEIQSDWHNAGARTGFSEGSNQTEAMNRISEIVKERARVNREAPAFADINGLVMDLMTRLTGTEEGQDYVVSHTITRASLMYWVQHERAFVVDDRNVFAMDLEETNNEVEPLVLSLMSDEEKDMLRRSRETYSKLSDLGHEETRLRKKIDETPPDVPFAGSADTYHEYVMKHLLREAAEGDYDYIAWTTADMQSERWSSAFEEGYRIEYDQNIPKFMRKYTKQWGGKVEPMTIYSMDGAWSVRITPEMKEAVLHVGQPLFQQYDDSYDDTATEKDGRDLAYTRLQAENAILSDALKELQKLTAKQENTIGKLQQRLKLTKTPEVRENDARKLAARYLRETGSTMDKAELASALKSLGDYMLNGAVNEEELKARARDLAAQILSEAQETISADSETLNQIRSSVSGQKVYLDPDMMGELDAYGGFKAIKDRLFGRRVYLSGEKSADRISVDRLYEQLHADFGNQFFPEAGSDNGPANAGEEIRIIADVLNAAGGMTVNPYEQYMGEASASLANEIISDALSGIMRPVQTDADVWKSRKDALNERIKELKKQGELQDKEAARLWQTVYDLSMKLDKAESRYKTLQAETDYRTAQVREEGTARAAEIKAKERERANRQIAGLKEYYHDLQQRARDRREESAGTTKYRKQVQKKAKALYEMLMTNSDKKHVPEVLKKPLGEFLEALDFTSKRALRGGDETKADQAFAARMLALEQMLRSQQDYLNGSTDEYVDLGGYIDVSPDNLQFLKDTASLITLAMSEGRGYTINNMTAAQLKDLSNFLSALSAGIRNMNNFMANARFESVREAARGDWEYMGRLGSAGKLAGSGAVRLAGWENGTPYYIMKRFGEGGRAIFDGLARGWEKMAFNAQEIIKFTEKLYTTKEVNAWKNEIHDITLEDGSEIQMTTAQIMELSMLLNREQARKHIEKGGIRIGDIKTRAGTKQDTHNYHLTLKDIANITNLLNDRQRQVAKELQSYMARRGAEWGNEISMRRFGYNFYVEGESYYPIRTDDLDRPMADTDAQMNSMFRLLNLSSSKSLNPKASNALIVGDIFDTFSDHMADMAKLNGMGLPILDAIKWFNYKERINLEDGAYKTETMQKAMREAYGDQALRYFRTLMKDINGMTESGDRGTNLFGKLLSNYKIAAVGANLRVAFLQPTSYVRAMTVLKPQFLIGNLPSVKAYHEAMKYSGTAVWKALGYYDTDISKSMRGQIVHNDTVRDRIAEASMVLAEKGDQLTWSMLWTACKRQAAAENRGLKGEALMEKTADLFREVVYSSQVMDATLTRSEIMRGKTHWTKAMSAFMAEPTLSYNILLDMVSQYNLDVREHGKNGAWQRNSKQIGRAITVYVTSAAFAALVESIADAVRDDDDEEFWEKFKQALWGEDGKFLQGNLSQDLTILGKLPYVKNFISTIQGYTSGDMSMTAFNNLLNVYKIWEETIKLSTGAQDKATKITYYGKMTEWGKIYKTLQALSQLSGVAVSNMTRDVTAIWNTIMNGWKDDWKIRTYAGNQLTDEDVASWEEYVKPTGIEKSRYKKILTEADASGNNSVTQDEMGAWITEQLEAGTITEEEAQALWKSRWHKPKSKTLDKWRESAGASAEETPEPTPEATPEPTPTPKPTPTPTPTPTPKPAATPKLKTENYDSFMDKAPIYGREKREAIYNVWETRLKPNGMSLERFEDILKTADVDSNGSLKQVELGSALLGAIEYGEIPYETAVEIWNTQGWKKTFDRWAGW